MCRWRAGNGPQEEWLRSEESLNARLPAASASWGAGLSLLLHCHLPAVCPGSFGSATAWVAPSSKNQFLPVERQMTSLEDLRPLEQMPVLGNARRGLPADIVTYPGSKPWDGSVTASSRGGD